MKRIATLALLALTLPFLLSACGGGPSDEDQIRDAVDQIATADDPAENEAACRDRLTRRFLDEVYLGDIAACAKRPINDNDEIKNPGETKVAAVTVEGPEATVKITTEGGDNDGVDGTWTMADDDGDWKLDRLEDDYLRANFLVSVKNVKEGMFAFEPLRGCMLKEVPDLDAGKLRRFTFLAARDDQAHALDLGNSIAETGCPLPLAKYVADVLATEVIAKKDVTPATVRCARKGLTPMLLATGLTKQVLKGGNEFGSATAPALAGLIAGVVRTCPSG